MNGLVRKPELESGCCHYSLGWLWFSEAWFPHLLNHAVRMVDSETPFYKATLWPVVTHLWLGPSLAALSALQFTLPSQIIPTLQHINEKESLYCWFHSFLGGNYNSQLLTLHSPNAHLIFLPDSLFDSLPLPLPSRASLNSLQPPKFLYLIQSNFTLAQIPFPLSCLRAHGCGSLDFQHTGCTSSTLAAPALPYRASLSNSMFSDIVLVA